MILADTSVWVDHLRRRNPAFAQLLEEEQVLIHPFVIGELALGDLQPRGLIVRYFDNLPQSKLASYQEVLHFIDRYKLFGSGIGYVDAHLLASTQLTPGTTFWTGDKRLHGVAERLQLAVSPAALP
jgi:predicted nucleic acid-binding protein